MQMAKQIVIQGIFKTIKGMFKNYKRNILRKANQVKKNNIKKKLMIMEDWSLWKKRLWICEFQKSTIL